MGMVTELHLLKPAFHATSRHPRLRAATKLCAYQAMPMLFTPAEPMVLEIK